MQYSAFRPEGHAYEKENQQYIEAGEMFYHLMRHTNSCCGIYINNLQKRTLQKCLKIRLELNQLRANIKGNHFPLGQPKIKLSSDEF